MTAILVDLPDEDDPTRCLSMTAAQEWISTRRGVFESHDEAASEPQKRGTGPLPARVDERCLRLRQAVRWELDRVHASIHRDELHDLTDTDLEARRDDVLLGATTAQRDRVHQLVPPQSERFDQARVHVVLGLRFAAWSQYDERESQVRRPPPRP